MNIPDFIQVGKEIGLLLVDENGESQFLANGVFEVYIDSYMEEEECFVALWIGPQDHKTRGVMLRVKDYGTKWTAMEIENELV